MSSKPVLQLLLVFSLIYASRAWENEDLELFDLVEEINKNFYEELGVAQDATSSDIRKAYRKLSLQLHPDKNKAEGAEVQFRQLVAMYEVLKDSERRKKYDQVLEMGLPDWRQPVYYYRKVRKFGLLEMTLALFLIFTVGHFIVIWSIYFEKRFELEEVFNMSKPKKKKGRKARQQPSEEEEDEMLQETLSAVPRPRLTDILPIKCVRGLYCGIVGLPELVASVKEHMEEQKRRKAEEEEQRRQEELDKLQEPVEKRPRQRRVVVEAERCEYEAPVSYTQVQEQTTPQETHTTVRTGPWSSEDDHLLAKAVARFPGGTTERWEKIAEFMGRPANQVIKKTKTMKTGFNKGVDVAAQGITGALGENVSMKKGKTISSEISTRTCEELHNHSGAPGGGAKSKKTVSFSEHNDFVTTDSLLKSNNENKLSINSSDVASKEGLVWSQNQQKIFEWALGQCPKGTAERWDRIAEHIPGKNKDDCIARFKVLAEIVKKRKQQQQAS